MFTFRFDMRAPSFGAARAELYQAAIEMTAWGEDRGLLATVLCEHHGSPDGYLSAPLPLAVAMAARTKRLPIKVAIIQLPLYDPIRLAEEMNVIDIISAGRVSYVGGVGYLKHEYEASGVDFHSRGKIADEKLALLLRALAGEPFEHEGRRIHVTPQALTPGGPRIDWGGQSVAAAKRAGRFGIGFLGEAHVPGLDAVYAEACRENGHPAGQFIMPATAGSVQNVFVADDLDQAWDELSPFLMHDVLAYGDWNKDRDHTSLSKALTAAQLRAESRSHRIMTVDEAVAHAQSGMPIPLHPLIGGLPPTIAWKYLRNVTEKVMPALAKATL